MRTIKLSADRGYRSKIVEAESVTVLRPDNGSVEISCHGVLVNGERMDVRFDLPSQIDGPPTMEGDINWTRAIIENANGKTTEILYSDAEFMRRAA